MVLHLNDLDEPADGDESEVSDESGDPSESDPTREARMDKASSTVLLPAELLDVACQLADSQAVAGRPSRPGNVLSPADKARLEPILEPDGRLHPIAASMLATVTRASLRLTIELSYDSDSTNHRIWSTAHHAVASNGLFPDLYMLSPVNAMQLPQVIGQFLVVRSPTFVADEPLRIDRADLMRATGANGHDEAMAVLTELGFEPFQAALLLDLQRPNVRRWRISSTWSTSEGQTTAELAGIDAGENGQWVAVGSRRPDESIALSYQPQDNGDLMKALRLVLPKMWTNTPVNTSP